MNAAELTKLYNDLSNKVIDLQTKVRVLEDNNAKLYLTIKDMSVDIRQLQHSGNNIIAAYAEAKENLGSVYGSCQLPDRYTVTRRTKGEQKAYLDGYEMCAECIENYLTDEGKQKLVCLLSSVRNAVEIEDTCDTCKEPCIMYEKGAKRCKESEVNEDDSI